jgi:hypothetical protein
LVSIMAVRGTDTPLTVYNSFAGSDRCLGVTKYASVSARLNEETPRNSNATKCAERFGPSGWNLASSVQLRTSPLTLRESKESFSMDVCNA